MLALLLRMGVTLDPNIFPGNRREREHALFENAIL